MSKFRIFMAAVLLAVTGLLVAPVTSAHATTWGNVLCDSSKSDFDDPGLLYYDYATTLRRLYRGHCSTEYTSHVQAFRVHPDFACRSQWGYTYAGEQYYTFKSNNNYLVLTCHRIYV